ncbi:MAG: hypothetical protein WC069_00135 [Candidatus Shapirobacteria bacterium]
MSTLSSKFIEAFDARYPTVLVVKTETGAEAIIPAGAVSWQRDENSVDTSDMSRTSFCDDVGCQHIVWISSELRMR